MSEEIPLITRKPRGEGWDYSICTEGVFLLKKLRSKKLRIIFNVTHGKATINQFNHWMLGTQAEQECERQATSCLTINTHTKELSEDRVVVILTAYQFLQDSPLMVLLGYLGASVFIYHHFEVKPNQDSQLTQMLSKLQSLLTETDVNKLNSQLSYSKGYASTPYFLCLMSNQHEEDLFQQVYRCQEGNDQLNRAIDTLIDYFPKRRALNIAMDKKNVSEVGNGFQNEIVGRTVFNFQFTGGTLQNLCFDCCEAFNEGKIINLSECYLKIIMNQKTRLEGQSIQHFMLKLSSKFFFGGKVDIEGDSQLPLSSYELQCRYQGICEQVLGTALQSATSCMTLSQFRTLQQSLRKHFSQKYCQLNGSNSQHANQLCSECFGILDNLEESQYNSDNLYTLIGQIYNNLGLFASECQVLTKGDHVQQLLWEHHSKLCQHYFGQLETVTREVVSDLVIQDQEQRVEIEDLRYQLRLKQNQLRNLQFQYQIQGDILNQTKLKFIGEDSSPQPPNYTFETNKLRRRVQELEQEVREKGMNIQELDELLQRFEGIKEKDRNKYKFTKEVQELLKDISQSVNSYYNVVRQTKQVNELEEEIKQKYAKQRTKIQEEQRHAQKQLAKKAAELQRMATERTVLEESLDEGRRTLQTIKQAAHSSKETLNLLERNFAEQKCHLAEVERQFEHYRKALLLLGEQAAKGGKPDKLLKFCNTSSIGELRDILRPFLKK